MFRRGDCGGDPSEVENGTLKVPGGYEDAVQSVVTSGNNAGGNNGRERFSISVSAQPTTTRTRSVLPSGTNATLGEVGVDRITVPAASGGDRRKDI